MCRTSWRLVFECVVFVYISVTIFVWYEDECGTVYMHDSYFGNSACDYNNTANLPF
jgi:hypothetical protein